MTDTKPVLDIDRVRTLFDLRGAYHEWTGGSYTGDLYAAWSALREEAPVHEGVVHELSGLETPAGFHGLPEPDRPHFSAFTYAACDAVYRNEAVFASSPEAVDLEHGAAGPTNSMLSMGGTEHRRYRSLVQPSFVPAKAQWWIRELDRGDGRTLLIDSFEGAGRAELNVEFCAAIPVLTITGSFGVPGRPGARRPRIALQPARADHGDAWRPIVAARREQPRDDLISVLVEAEITDEAEERHRLTDAEIYSFALLLLAAGSGTTWKQMGITLAALLQRPELLDAVRARSAACCGRRSRNRCGGRRRTRCSRGG